MEAAGRGWFGSSSRALPLRLVAGPPVGFNPPDRLTTQTRKAYDQLRLRREQLPNREPTRFGAGEECPPKRPNKTRCKAPRIEIPEPFTINGALPHGGGLLFQLARGG